MPPPKIALMRRWAQANSYHWETAVVRCGRCGLNFGTGDLFFSFPALDAAGRPVPQNEQPAIVVGRIGRYACTSCTHEALGKGLRFDGAGVFVEKRHQREDFDDLPGRIRDSLIEAFTLLDQLHANLEAAAKGEPQPEPS